MALDAAAPEAPRNPLSTPVRLASGSIKNCPGDRALALGGSRTDFLPFAHGGAQRHIPLVRPPSGRAAMTTVRCPVRITAPEGMNSACRASSLVMSTVPVMPGRKRPSGLGRAIRTSTVRLSIFALGRTASIFPLNGSPRKAGEYRSRRRALREIAKRALHRHRDHQPDRRQAAD